MEETLCLTVLSFIRKNKSYQRQISQTLLLVGVMFLSPFVLLVFKLETKSLLCNFYSAISIHQ